MITSHEQKQWTESLLILLMVDMLAGCPSKCICASDLLSCTNISLKELPDNVPATATSLDFSHNCISLLHNNWLSRVPHLHTLHLNHNQVRWLPARAFHNATELRYLDLSSNQLQSIHEEQFLHLLSLEELLLYNNHIAYVEMAAFVHLGNIQKIYLSWNNLSSFSFSSMQNLTNPHLRTLDLSSNKFVELPVEDVSSLPAFIKSGLYLHNNPLTCSCALYNLFIGWKQRSFPSVMDFSREHTCLYMGKRRALVRFLESQNGFNNCSVGMDHDTGVKVLVGRRIMVTCNTSLPQENTTYLWISPAYDFIFPPGNSNQSFKVHPNGSLEIQKAEPWNSGVYMCIAVNRRLSYNATHEVNVTVRFPKPEESFNTGLTTLLGCVVSLVLVFIYLYMTPCRCFHCCMKPPQTPSPPQESSAQSSILCGTPPASEGPNGRKAAASRHVVFLEPIKERRAGKNPKMLQLRSDSDLASSVFSDFQIAQT